MLGLSPEKFILNLVRSCIKNFQFESTLKTLKVFKARRVNLRKFCLKKKYWEFSSTRPKLWELYLKKKILKKFFRQGRTCHYKFSFAAAPILWWLLRDEKKFTNPYKSFSMPLFKLEKWFKIKNILVPWIGFLIQKLFWVYHNCFCNKYILLCFFLSKTKKNLPKTNSCFLFHSFLSDCLRDLCPLFLDCSQRQIPHQKQQKIPPHSFLSLTLSLSPFVITTDFFSVSWIILSRYSTNVVKKSFSQKKSF